MFQRLVQTIRRAEAETSDDASASRSAGVSRRGLLQLGAAVGATLTDPRWLAGCADSSSMAGPASRVGLGLAAQADIGIVGAGIAGLSCAYELGRYGIKAAVYEAAERVGGRIYSMGGSFPGSVDWQGQVSERGGEPIDTAPKTMIGYAREFGLTLADVTKPARETFYYFGGERVSESDMVAEYLALVDRMRADLRSIGAPTASAFTPAEQALDNISLKQ